MINIQEQIATALKHLGIRGVAKLIQIDNQLYKVELNGKYFGIYDIGRDTFVD